jgi:hypothetical protein
VRNGRARRYGERLAPLVAALEAANVDLETGALRGNRSFAAKLTEQLVRRRTPAKKKAD